MARPGARLVSGADLENLPSFGMSNYINIESSAETMAMIKNIGDGKIPTCRTQKPADTVSLPGPSSKVPPTILKDRNGQGIHVTLQDNSESEEQDPNEYGFKFAAATAPITSTVDASQIMETETNGTQDFGMTARPKLKVKMMTNYMRFRYMSEKCPKKKGSKPRQYESEDVDKHCLAEVWVDNYDDAGKIVAYCVDSTGKLHPYNLFGEGCHQGVYVHRSKFRNGKITRLNKVSVTTPKAKEYKENLENQLSYLSQVGIQDIKFCKADDINDKQIVYIMFKVILDDGETLSTISTPLQNKKKGKEFLIDDVEPVCCPANISSFVNPWKYRVMLHVTEGTAFPSEVGLKVREKDSSGNIVWEEDVAKESIKTVKQCVVKFIPPSYRNPDTKKDVEVKICLYDKVTKNETYPFTFTYKGSDNVKPEMNIENKAKKRKLTEDIDMSNISFVPDEHVRGERKTLTALHSRHNSSSGSSDRSTPDNTMPYQETQSYPTTVTDIQNQSSLNPTGIEEGCVSVRPNQQGNGQLPFENYIEQNLGQNVNQSSSPQSAGFRGQMSGEIGMQASSNQSSLVTSTTSVFCTTETTSNQNVSSNMSTMYVSSNSGNTSNQQQQPTSEELPSQVMFLSESGRQQFQQQGCKFPKLGPNQMLAVIGGQIYVVNDDMTEQAQPPVLDPPSAVQNIGEHQVIIQQVALQQPASEAEQTQAGLSSTISQGASQLQMFNGLSQSGGNPIATTSTHSAVDQSALQQQQNLLLHLVLLQQQQGLIQQQQQQQQQGFQQQQGLHQQQQDSQQLSPAAGFDINAPDVLNAFMQQINEAQQLAALQQGILTNNSASTSVFGAGADLNDDDLEEDGGGTMSDRNTSKSRINKPMSVKSETGQRKKKKRTRSGKGKAMYEEEDMEYVEGQVDEDSKIPVFVNEVTVGEDSNDSDSYNKVMSRNVSHYTLKNGSFGNDIYSEDDNESR